MSQPDRLTPSEAQCFASYTTPEEKAEFYRKEYIEARNRAERAEQREAALESKLWHAQHPGYDAQPASPPPRGAMRETMRTPEDEPEADENEDDYETWLRESAWPEQAAPPSERSDA